MVSYTIRRDREVKEESVEDLSGVIDDLLVPKEGRIVVATCVGEEPFPAEEIGNPENPVYFQLFSEWVVEAQKKGWVDENYIACVNFYRNHLSYPRNDTGKWYFAISTDVDRNLQ